MDILILSPVDRGSRKGNGVTVRRWEKIFSFLGHTVRVETALPADNPPDLFVALHARRSADELRDIEKHFPGIPVVLALTGTDLYRDIREDEYARGSLDLADCLIVLQEWGLEELDPRHRKKAVVLHQSIDALPWSDSPPDEMNPDDFNVVQLAHLRPVKDPFRVAEAVEDIPASSNLQAYHLGEERKPGFEDEARQLTDRIERYHWIGGRPRREARWWLSEADLMVISSRLEGGAHVVSEAIACETPVVASRMPGNVGLLGEDYEGYFEVENSDELREQLIRAETDGSFRQQLTDQLRDRQHLTDPIRERDGWTELLEEITKEIRV